MTRQEILQEMIKELESVDIESAVYDSRVLLEWTLGIDRSEFYMNPMKELTTEELIRLRQVTAQRKSHEPLQYIMKEAEFMGYSFYVDENVLIPRFDTECLVEHVVQQLAGENVELLDLCCGSGCIGLSIKKIRPQTRVTLSDLSQGALTVTRKNAKRLEADVEVMASDLFEALNGRKFDVIVSNPPYIPTRVIEGLMPEVREHEPMMALDGTEDGLWFYRRITQQALSHLTKGGLLSFEIGAEQGESVSGMMREAGFQDVIVKKDLAGLDRIVSGVKG